MKINIAYDYAGNINLFIINKDLDQLEVHSEVINWQKFDSNLAAKKAAIICAKEHSIRELKQAIENIEKGNIEYDL